MAKTISSLNTTLTANAGPFSAAFRQAETAARSFGSTVTGAAESASSALSGIASAGSWITDLASPMAAVAGGMAIFSVATWGLGKAFDALKGGIVLAAQLEQTGVAFETIFHSATAAKNVMGELKAFAASTPFQFPELATAAKKLAAFGTSADQITPTLKVLGDIASGVGAPIDELAGAYGKVETAGRLTGETLQQFNDRGIPLLATLASQAGVSTAEITKMITAGQVGFPQVQKALAGLAGPGGQFAGMMQKQSTTLNGLWSTLSDNVSMTFAGIAQTVADAFHFKDALKVLIDFTGTAGDWINAAVAKYAPTVVAAGEGILSAAAGVWSSVYDTVAPIVTGIGDFVARNWQGMVEATVTYLGGVYDVVSGLMTAVGQAMTATWSGITAVWDWGCGLVGSTATTAGATASGAFQRIVDAGKWLYESVGAALSVIGFGLSHLGQTFDLVGANVAVAVAGMVNDVAYAFTTQVPAYLSWLGQNWTQIFTDLFNFTGTVFANLGRNAGNAFVAIWDALSGNGFTFDWTPLTTGFKATVSALPEIAARQAGPIEAELKKEAAAAAKAYGQTFNDYMAAGQGRDAGIAKGIMGGVDAAAAALKGLSAVVVKPPVIEQPKPFKVDTTGATKPLDEVTKKAGEAKGAMQGLDAVLSGSAASMKAAYMALHPGVLHATADVAGVVSPAPPMVDVKAAAFGNAITSPFPVRYNGASSIATPSPFGSITMGAMPAGQSPVLPGPVAGNLLAGPDSSQARTGGLLAGTDQRFATAPVAYTEPALAPVPAKTVEMATKAGGGGGDGTLLAEAKKQTQLLSTLIVTNQQQLNVAKTKTGPTVVDMI